MYLITKKFVFVILFFSFLNHANGTVFIQSVDALGWKNLESIEAKQTLTNSFFRQPEHATYQLSVQGTGNTGPSHATAFTGITPENGGWIANNFILPDSPLRETHSAFTSVNPVTHNNLVHRLKKQNKSIACLNVPTLNMISKCDLHLAFRRRLTESCRVTLNTPHTQGQLQGCLGESAATFQYANSRLDYLSKQLSVPHEQVVQLCWVDGDDVFTRLMWRETVDNADQLYIGPTHGLRANEQFRQLAKDYVCWPGVLDPASVRQGKITHKGFWQINQYQHTYGMNLAKHVLSLNKFDVVVNYTSLLDSMQHEMLVHNEHKLKGQLDQYIRDSYQLVSDDLQAIGRMLAKDDNMLVFSDHGMVRAHTTVMMNGLLASLGWVTQGKSAQIRAVTSGALVHIYVDDKKANLDELKNVLSEFKINGQRLFSQVYDKKSQLTSGLNHPNSGRIVAVANQGFSFDPRVPPTERFAYPTATFPDDLEEQGLTGEEKQFILSGTPNRVSPGVHGFQSKNVNINGIVTARGPVEAYLNKMPTRGMDDLLGIMLKAVE